MPPSAGTKAKHPTGKTKDRASRAPWGTISRDQIVDAALEVVKAGGYGDMTIRSLALRMGVSPMSLYRHVRDKDDLLDEVVDHLLEKAWQPKLRTEDWTAWLAEAADKLRSFLVSQPVALHVYLRHPVVSPAAVERMEEVMGVLRGAGFTEPAARRAYASLHTYTVGFAALEASRAGWTPGTDGQNHLAQQLADYTTPRQFAEGLRYLLEGIERQVTTEARPLPPSSSAPSRSAGRRRARG